jgi:hypothetical protein
VRLHFEEQSAESSAVVFGESAARPLEAQDKGIDEVDARADSAPATRQRIDLCAVKAEAAAVDVEVHQRVCQRALAAGDQLHVALLLNAAQRNGRVRAHEIRSAVGTEFVGDLLSDVTRQRICTATDTRIEGERERFG